MSAVSVRALLTPAQYGTVLLALEEFSNDVPGPGLVARRALDKILVGTRPKAAAAEHPNMKAMESRIRAEIAAEIRAAAVAAEPFMMHFVDWTGGVDLAIKIIEKGELTWTRH